MLVAAAVFWAEPAWAVEVPLAELQAGGTKSAVVVFDIGQGNCALLSCPSGNKVLMDCGTKESDKDERLDSARALFKEIVGKSGIHGVVISHPDGDHYNLVRYFLNGLPSPGATPTLDVALLGGPESQYASYFKPYLNGLKTSSGAPTSVKAYKKDDHDQPPQANPNILCGRTGMPQEGLYVLASNMKGGTSTNENSLVATFYHHRDNGPFRVLFGGDAGFVTEEAILKRYNTNDGKILLQTEVMLAGHHGSGNKTASLQWVNATAPRTVLYSAGERDNWRHPRCSTVDAYQTARLYQEKPHLLTCGVKQSKTWATYDKYAKSQFNTNDLGALVMIYDSRQGTYKIYTCKNNDRKQCDYFSGL